jgi:hypothetical protein
LTTGSIDGILFLIKQVEAIRFSPKLRVPGFINDLTQAKPAELCKNFKALLNLVRDFKRVEDEQPAFYFIFFRG